MENTSKGRYSREKAIEIRDAARVSVGSNMPAKSLELKHTLRLIGELDSEISEIESEIKQIMDQISSPILTIPRIGYRTGAMILAEIGDFSRFDSPDKILAYAGASPSTYQSGQLDSSYSHMEKRGSRYLRFALINVVNMFATGMKHLVHIFRRRFLKGNTITLPSLTQQKNSCG